MSQQSPWSDKRPASYRPLTAYLEMRNQGGKHNLQTLVPFPVLLLDERVSSGDSGKFGTALVASVGQRAGLVTETTCVVPITKRVADKAAPAKAARFIWVGRQPSCDIWLPFEGVSKLHAQFVRSEDGKFQLGDAGSKNGTFLSSTQLTRTAVDLPDRARLRFGRVELTYFTPERFWEELALIAKLTAGT